MDGSLQGDITDPELIYKYHVLDYEFVEITQFGLKYRSVREIDNRKYDEGMLRIELVWESNAKEYAWELVSYLTS